MSQVFDLPTHCLACGAPLEGGRTRHSSECPIAKLIAEFMSPIPEAYREHPNVQRLAREHAELKNACRIEAKRHTPGFVDRNPEPDDTVNVSSVEELLFLEGALFEVPRGPEAVRRWIEGFR
jgi:hypothetical protein